MPRQTPLYNELPLLPGIEEGLHALNGHKISLGMACRCCGKHRVEMVLDLGDQPHCNRLIGPDDPNPPFYPLRLGFCHDCTLVQIDHTIPKEEMFSDYPYVSGTTETLRAHFRETTERLEDWYDVGADDLVVDIGSNDGTWLRCWNDGKLVGVEPDARLASESSGGIAFIHNDFFDDRLAWSIANSHGTAKIITAAGVFFHLEELHSVCRGINMLLADDGVFIVQAIYLGGMIENTAFDQIYHEHLCYYTLKSLQALLNRHGLHVFDVHMLPIHGGTIEAHICRIGSRQVTKNVFDLAAQEKAKNLDRIWTYHTFADDVRVIRRDLLAVFDRYRSDGKTVWAYGAPAKGATLLNSFGIGVSHVACAVEKNTRKVGKLIPGCRIPIVAESDERPDAYLVLAWNFLDEFMVKERAFLEGGGRFIVPVPSVSEIAL